MPFAEWSHRYCYFENCMMTHLEKQLEPSLDLVTWDGAGLRRDLERHLYATSHNRFYAFDLLK